MNRKEGLSVSKENIDEKKRSKKIIRNCLIMFIIALVTFVSLVSYISEVNIFAKIQTLLSKIDEKIIISALVPSIVVIIPAVIRYQRRLLELRKEEMIIETGFKVLDNELDKNDNDVPTIIRNIEISNAGAANVKVNFENCIIEEDKDHQKLSTEYSNRTIAREDIRRTLAKNIKNHSWAETRPVYIKAFKKPVPQKPAPQIQVYKFNFILKDKKNET